MLLDILAHYPWAAGVPLDDVQPSELGRLDMPYARARIELATIRSSVDNSEEVAKLSPNEVNDTIKITKQ